MSQYRTVPEVDGKSTLVHFASPVHVGPGRFHLSDSSLLDIFPDNRVFLVI